MKPIQKVQHSWNILKITILSLFLFPLGVAAQGNYQLVSGGSLKVLGTSNVHDWTMTSSGIESQGAFKVNSRDELIGLSNFSFTVIAKSLKSGKSSMDNRTYKSIKADQFQKISYVLKSAVVNKDGEKFNIVTTGNLTIAGVTQTISMLVTGVVNDNKSITCKGSEKIKLTDYKIDPPSFMLGAMKVGNDLVIQFELTYAK